MTTFPAVSHLEDSQSLTFDKIQLLQEVSNSAYNSEFHVYIKIKILAVRMNVIMGMQIKKSERHSNSTLDWRCQGADIWGKCRVNFELKKKMDFPTSKPLNKPLWVTTEPAVPNWQDTGFPPDKIHDFLLYSIVLSTIYQTHKLVAFGSAYWPFPTAFHSLKHWNQAVYTPWE